MSAGQQFGHRHFETFCLGLTRRYDHRMPGQFLRFGSVLRRQDELDGGRFGGRSIIRHFNGHFEAIGGERQSSL